MASTPVRTTRLPRPERRAQLLSAARAVFVADGFHAASMDQIADQAGVSKPVLYQHFTSKQELYLALLEESAARLASSVRAALAATTDNSQRVTASIAAYLDFVDGPESAYRLVFESDLRSDPAVRAIVEGSLMDSVSAIADTIAADTGADPHQAGLLSAALVGIAEVGSRWWLADGARVPKEQAARLLSDLAWRGISSFPLSADASGAVPGPSNV
jgi:AcrR family transcriptional regulator